MGMKGQSNLDSYWTCNSDLIEFYSDLGASMHGEHGVNHGILEEQERCYVSGHIGLRFVLG